MASAMALTPPYPVRTRRLLLRPLGDGDVDALVAYRSLPEVCRYVPFEPMDADRVRERLRGIWAATTIEEEGDVLILGAELAATGELVGDLMLCWSSAEHRCG